MTTKKVAIACQGGGTHAAFTWGVLSEILETKKKWDAEQDQGAGFAWKLHSSTKLDRGRQHIESLHDEGREVAREWISGWRQCDDDFPAYPDDARYSECAEGC